MDSPTPTPRRSRHAKSQSTSALSTILDDSPAFRDDAPPVPAIPSYLRSETPKGSPKKTYDPYDRPQSSLSGRQSHLPGLTYDQLLTRSSSFQTASDEDSSSSTPSRGISRSRTLHNVAEPGSPTPKRKSRRPMDTLDDPLQPLQPTATSSPIKRRPRETNRDSPIDTDSRTDTSRAGSSHGSQSTGGSRTLSESFESSKNSLESNLQKWARVLQSHRTESSERLDILNRMQRRLAVLVPAELPRRDAILPINASDLCLFFELNVHRTLLDLLFRHAAVLPYLPPIYTQRVDILKEVQLIASLLQGLCLLEGFVSTTSHCRNDLSEVKMIEIMVDLLRFTWNDTSAYKVTSALLQLTFCILANTSSVQPSSSSTLSVILQFVNAGGTEVLAALMRSNDDLGRDAYNLAEFIAKASMKIQPRHHSSRKVSTDRSTSRGSFESMTTDTTRSGTVERDLRTPCSDFEFDVDRPSSRTETDEPSNTPRTPTKLKTPRVPPATSHSSGLPRSATSSAINGFYTPSARGEKRHFNRTPRGEAQKLGRVLEEESLGTPRRSNVGSPSVVDFGSDLDETMHSTIRGKPDVFGSPAVKEPSTRLPRTRSTMGPEIISRSSSSKKLANLGNGIAVGSPRRVSGSRTTGLRSTSGGVPRVESSQPGSRLKKSSTMMSLSGNADVSGA